MRGHKPRWKVTFENKAAECAYSGEGATRHRAFDDAVKHATEPFFQYKITPDLQYWWWEGYKVCYAALDHLTNQWARTKMTGKRPSSFTWRSATGAHLRVTLRRINRSVT